VPASGWLKDFHFQSSRDGKKWTDIPGTAVEDNNTDTQLAKFVEGCGYPFIIVPHHQMSLAVLPSLRHPPLGLLVPVPPGGRR
jgi:hypothetical protein